MSTEVEAVLSKLNASSKLSRVLNSRGTEIENDKVLALDLSLLGISELPAGVFDNLKDLERLNLGYNNLTKVETKSFSGLTKLNFLSLFENKLTELPDDFLKTFPGLTWLDLRENNLSKIPPSILELSKLEYLYMQNNSGLTTDKFDFSEDYHSKRDVGKFFEEYKKSMGMAPAEKPAKTAKKATTKQSEPSEESE